MRRERACLACGVLGASLFVVVFLLESLVHPAGYDPLRHTVSAFALGPYGWVQRANFLASGALLLAYAIGLRRAGTGWLVAVLVGLLALGLMGSGIATCDPISSGVSAAHPYPLGSPVPAGRTTHGILHDLFGTPVFLGLPVACAVMARRFAVTGRRAWSAYSAATAVLFVAAFVLTSSALARPPAVPAVGGLLQRVTLLIGWIWLAAVALHLRRKPLSSSRTRPMCR